MSVRRIKLENFTGIKEICLPLTTPMMTSSAVTKKARNTRSSVLIWTCGWKSLTHSTNLNVFTEKKVTKTRPNGCPGKSTILRGLRVYFDNNF